AWCPTRPSGSLRFMPNRIGVFMLAALVLVAVPGPDVLYITARGMDQGRLAGLVCAWSAALGGLVLTVGAALGLSRRSGPSIALCSIQHPHGGTTPVCRRSRTRSRWSMGGARLCRRMQRRPPTCPLV